MLIRGETPADIAAIHALNKAAFKTDAEAKLVDGLRDNGNLSLSLVADDGGIVGHVAFSPMTFVAKAGSPKPPLKAAGLAPVAVAESHRRQGIAAALIKEGLTKAKAIGVDVVFVLGDDKYYPRFGFCRAIDYGIESPYAKTENHFFVLELRPNSLGGMKGLAVYTDKFFRFLRDEEEKFEMHMTAEEAAAAASYAPDLIKRIDERLYRETSTDGHWLKTARIIGATLTVYPDIPEACLLERLISLVERGELEHQGNLRLVRFSEVRRPFK